jgi:hypothetical protein
MSFGLRKDFLINRVLAKALYLALASRDNMRGKHRSSTLLKRGILVTACRVDAVAVAM